MNTATNIDSIILTPLYEKFSAEFGAKKAQNLKHFTSKYFTSSSRDTLSRLSTDRLFNQIMLAWSFIQKRSPGTPKLNFVQLKKAAVNSSSGDTLIQLLVDDMPFLVDSVRQRLVQKGVTLKAVHNTVIFVQRSESDPARLKKFSLNNDGSVKPESLMVFRCANLSDQAIAELESALLESLNHVALAVQDYGKMCRKIEDLRVRLLKPDTTLPLSSGEIEDSAEFLEWILNNHFTFLGYEEYQLHSTRKGEAIKLEKKSLLGVSRLDDKLQSSQLLSDLPGSTERLLQKRKICAFAKSTTRSLVHRPAYYDCILVREFNKAGKVEKEHRFLGLYTSSVYFRFATEIPLLRHKVNRVLERSGFAKNGHSYKDLMQVINVLPRDELFQMSTGQLLETAVKITQIQEIRRTRLFMRKDEYGKFISCLIYVPRDIYDSEVRQQITAFLCEKLGAGEVEYDAYFSESILARLQLTLRVPDISKIKVDVTALEAEISALIRPWIDEFQEKLLEDNSDQEAKNLVTEYGRFFSSAYRESYTAAEAVEDIELIRRVIENKKLSLDYSVSRSQQNEHSDFKIFSYGKQLVLSDVAPILENMGLQVISEKSFKLDFNNGHCVWMHDFLLSSPVIFDREATNLKAYFEDAFAAIWSLKTDDDNFNALVPTSLIPWRDVALLRAYAAYLKQIQIGYTPAYIAETLVKHQAITNMLLETFYLEFDPELNRVEAKKELKREAVKMTAAIDKVENLAEDTVLRTIVSLFSATLRTNFFQTDSQGEPKPCLSFKILPELVEAIPKPKPKFEIFVFSPRMEGVHLRGGKVARGGLRWSDRREDYRTEVLGLVKAQQVKNSVIVPVGAKGGFVVKQPPKENSRQAILDSGIACYKLFIQGLLDLTDNRVKNEIVKPPQLVAKDENDSYLVVAADKGTATFSDIANGIARDYDFWLGDAFASGGSNGYDHKKMGITAKGAWVSVQRHFRELKLNVQTDEFTTVGIGDMAGDVFGNGMLSSNCIQLVGAFNHLHIFIDPNPDAAASFKERERLFKNPQLSWADYKSDLISKGGGVFSRSVKSIPVSAEMKARFDLSENKITPNKLISALLKSAVDLIWNGGIGTYVKASSESHLDAGDKANDALRVDARELRCRVIGEGGNLGLTQLARIEFGLDGGITLTDFIDNSGGVDCSDHEVNIKILLNKLSLDDEISEKNRNKLLSEMTEAVAKLVLSNNYHQVQTIGVAYSEMDKRVREYAGVIPFLEKYAGLDRKLEYLPTDEVLEERISKGQGLTRPEIAVMTSHMKMHIKSHLISANYLKDDFLLPYLYSAFPDKLSKGYAKALQQHQLRAEIVATQLANTLVNLLGPSFVYRMFESTSATTSEIVKATVIAMEIYSIKPLWEKIEALDYKIEVSVQNEMFTELIRLMRKTTRWLLRNRRRQLDFVATPAHLQKPVTAMFAQFPKRLPELLQQRWEQRSQHYRELGVPTELLNAVVSAEYIRPIPALVDVSERSGVKLAVVMDIYYGIGERLQLNWLSQLISNLSVTSYWQALSRESFQEDLDWQQRALTQNVVESMVPGTQVGSVLENWCTANADLIQRLQLMLLRLQREGQADYPMFSVTLRELLNLAQSTVVVDEKAPR